MTLAQRLRARPTVVAPGVWDTLSALLAEQAGFEALFLSGSALAFSQLGRPDVGLLSVHELADSCARITDRIVLPLLVDADSGYGNIANLQRTVRLLERGGAAAVQIEDQMGLKPADALQYRPLATTGEMVARIKAAQDARGSDALLISARTDAPATLDLDATLRRCEAYIAAGCDLLFVEGVRSRADAVRIGAAFGGTVPLVHNLLDGKSPFDAAAELEPLGFALALMPLAMLGVVTKALGTVLPGIRSAGSTAAARGQMLDSVAINALIGTPGFLAHAAALREAG